MSDVLRFAVNNRRNPEPGERVFDVELADGRVATILAESVSLVGGLSFLVGGEVVLALAAATWRSVIEDPRGQGALVDLPKPPEKAPKPEKPERPPKKAAAPRPTPTRLPRDWNPTRELIDELSALYPAVDQKAEFQKFRAYYLTRPDDDAVRPDWSRCWQLWVERAADRASAVTGAAGKENTA